MELTPKKIYEDFETNKIDKRTAADLLFSLIDNSDKEKIRVESINELEHIGVNDVKTFKHLELLLLSDSSEKVRNAMGEALKSQKIDFKGELGDFAQLYFDGMNMAKVNKNSAAYNQAVRGLVKLYGMEVNKHEINGDLRLSELLDYEAEFDAKVAAADKTAIDAKEKAEKSLLSLKKEITGRKEIIPSMKMSEVLKTKL